jgi:hypothetical protein
MECPCIDRSFTPDPEFNEPVTYRRLDGSEEYVFYKHDDGTGKITRVQFCRFIGRKRDVFECLNEGEWKRCPYYRSAVEMGEIDNAL